MSWNDFLVAMRGPEINTAVGVLIYVLANHWPRFGTLTPRNKRLAVMALSVLVPILATLLSVLTLGLPFGNWATTWWPALVAGVMAYVTSQGLHLRDLPSG